MLTRETAINYTDEDTSRAYESIDEVLCVLGGRRRFSMKPRVNDIVHAYDFHDNAAVLVYVASKNDHKPEDHWYKYPITVHLLGFRPGAFYKKLYGALSDLGREKPYIWQKDKQQP